MMKDILNDFAGFQWDDGNKNKNIIRHGVENWESEQIFFNEPLIILDDPEHSTTEERWAAFGRTEADRFLVVIFTKRGRSLRVISSRDMNDRERDFYEKNG